MIAFFGAFPSRNANNSRAQCYDTVWIVITIIFNYFKYNKSGLFLLFSRRVMGTFCFIIIFKCEKTVDLHHKSASAICCRFLRINCEH
jgi:hypothetical protein